MKKKATSKILSKSITGVPMECFEGEKKNFCPRSVYIKFFLKVFPIEKILKNTQKSVNNPLFGGLRHKLYVI